MTEDQGGRVEYGEDCHLQPHCEFSIGLSAGETPTRFGNHCTIRSGSRFYSDVETGSWFQTGHNILVRGKTRIGDHVVIGTGSVIDGEVTIGNFVKIETNCYIPTHVRIGSRVFLGPNVVLTNDQYPLRQRESYQPAGAIIEDNVTLGANAVICPGVRVGAGSFVAAGAVVTKDVPAKSFVAGVPGRVKPLPEHLNEPNTALSWRKFLDETA